MTRLLTMVYSLASYFLGVASLVLLILFANNHIELLGISELSGLGIDQGLERPFSTALAINIGLIVVFSLQHSIMARPGFKAGLTRILPAAAERSTYVLATAIVTFALIYFWSPMTGNLWHVEDPNARLAITVVYYAGWTITLLATFMINHFHLFGLQQAFKSGDPDAGTKTFVTPLFYKLVRHPIQTGIAIGLLATPDMTVGRLVLTLGMGAYIFIGLRYEERDLVAEFGDTYRDYMKRVPRLFPGIGG